MPDLRLKPLFPVLALTATLAGCALPAPSGCMSEPQSALVVLPNDVMGPAERRVRFTDPKEFDEFVLYRGAGGERLEAVYLETRKTYGDNVVLLFQDTLAERVLGFAYNAGTHPAFGEAARIKTAFGGMWVRPFTHTVTGQTCAGFLASWDNRSEDTKNRPSKAIYGYYCAAAGKHPNLEAADSVLTHLEAGLTPVQAGTGDPTCAGAGILSTRPEGEAILMRGQATGAAGSPAAFGDAEFPPVRAVRFQEGGPDLWWEM